MNTAITAVTFTPSDLLAVAQDQITTTSLKVAEAFGKQHKDVLRKIENLECPDEFASAHFCAHVQTVEIGNGATRESKVYRMTKDGFMLLVMGFTGKAAMATKIGYINAFNQMAAQLAKSAEPTQPKRRAKALPNGLTLEQQDSVKQLVKARVEALPQNKQAKAAITCWSALKSKFGTSYKEIAPEQFSEALSLVARLPLDGMEGELLLADALAQPSNPVSYHYPLAEWVADNRGAMGPQYHDSATVPLDALIGGGAWSAIGRLLGELDRQQHDVSACRAELRALKCHLEQCHTKLGQIAEFAATARRYVWREYQ